MEPIKTEPIKQEIINNIFENGDKLITGPILQTVLIDMIDDVNVKDQEILSKTGSWDEAVTQIPNLATKAEVTNLSESIARDLENVVDVDLTGYATEQWVQDQGYLTEHQDISNLATKSELTEAENNLQGNITSLSESVARDIANVSVPEGVATEEWVQSQGYLKEHQDISGLATKTELNEAKDNLQGNITSLSESVARDLANVDVDLTGYATEAWVQSQDYASKSYVDNAVSSVDLTGYATETWVQSQGYLKEHQDISNLATKSELTSVSESIQTDISNLATKGELNEANNILQEGMIDLSGSVAKTIDDYTAGIITEIQNKDYASKTYVNEAVAGINLSDYATKTELTSVSESVQTDITNLSESIASSAVWKKGTGSDSIVQKLSGDNEANTPTATGLGAVATGRSTEASGQASHAEGNHTEASNENSHAEGTWTRASGLASHAEGDSTRAEGNASHAEGIWTNASGQWSHAEGHFTRASNDYEHAQGTYNHNSKNQIFSIGIGNSANDTRNAISVLAVSNADTKINTASIFIQNVGGYDGTNPLPGTNDLATVINNLPSGGGSSSGGSSETLWKKGTGQDSIVQKLSGDNEAKTPTATGTGSVAIGSETTASGAWSHAEGLGTTAEGWYSHAEGRYAIAAGLNSHAEGHYTRTSNDYEHAQGQYNHNSANQIFSVGAGENAIGTVTRRNAISVLAVPNSETRVVTASFFVQNIGGYDGTNPTPGTNDLATVINGMSSGGSSETLWKKGEGTDSIVQVKSGALSALLAPKATGEGAIATGHSTNASGKNSHAEGSSTKALEQYSHAEGNQTYASGQWSHAEGYLTTASNDFEHAQGRCNHSSKNQIFSIGTGNSNTDRRNAVSVLEVSNNNKYTSSFFVQNVGGYDGTNPLPGTNDLATVISGLSSGGGSSSGGSSETLWKKGEGQDSIVQILTGDNESKTPTATKPGAIAIGHQTIASGEFSHAEGSQTEASGYISHAEGQNTRASGYVSHAEGQNTVASEINSHAEGYFANASGQASHAEGNNTKASNDYEHAQGRYNHNSENQIFSIGTGNSDEDRRNAVSVLEVSNNNSYTSSVFIQNIGGYDGTNPTPGTNDLATVINGMAIEGGIGTSSETWTFTLEDGSTVTKNIVMR